MSASRNPTGRTPILTPEQVAQIRTAEARYGYAKRLAREYGVSVKTIRRARGRAYARYAQVH